MKRKKLLKQSLDYNPDTGIFTWKIRLSNNTHIGGVAGGLDKQGYVQITVYGKYYLAHRLAWFFYYGKWPEGIIDHKDTIKHHNWIKNLRDVTPTINSLNRIKSNSNNKLKLLGVSYHKLMNKYVAKITVQGKQKHIGYFPTSELASIARIKALQEYT